MSDKFECGQCGHDWFEDRGVIRFAGLHFQALICEKCGNYILLETNEYDYNAIETHSDIKMLSFEKK